MTAPLKMKDLEAQTGVSREAIHFYLREGLLPEPERPKRNVAHYSEEHVVRIRAIKQLQQDQALSLETIKTILEKFDYAAYSTADDLARFEIALHSQINGELPSADQKVSDVATRTGLTEEFIAELNDEGVVHIKNENGTATLDFRDVGILEHWSKVLDLGFKDKPGYDAAYLSRFAKAIDEIAKAEVDNFLSVFGEESSDDAADLAAKGIALTNEIVTRLRTQALMRALHNRVKKDAD